MQIVVKDLMASYQKVGKGKPLVFLHGWGDSAKTFTGLIAELKDEYEVYALDLPGFGGTQMPPRAWSLQDYADFLGAWIDKVGIKPYALIGHSYGSAVAIMAASHDADAKKLVLLASAGIRNKRPLRNKILAAGAKAGKVPLLVLPAHKQKSIKKKLYGSLGSDLMLVPHMEQTFRAIINEDVREPASKIKAQTLLVYGSKDKDTPVSDGRILNESIEGSRLEIIEAGHFLHQEKPEQVAGLIRSFLKEAK